MYHGEPTGDDAALIATITVQGRCFFADAPSGARYLVAFPADFADWDDTAGELTLGGETFKPFDRVQFGGSGHPLRNLGMVDWEQEPTPDCVTNFIWLSQERARLLARPTE
jgi:hypothetical protein